ncbi:MAG: hypothetical protein CL908_24810 [Deltaproteobacteria bacterium]|jgi:hypothetical protein|nr:hypothetical protein [Deltaproteobacteria bacterium]
MIELIPLATAELKTRKPIALGDTPRGQRIIGEVIEARFEGERFSARQVGAAAADWALQRPDGIIEIDARITLETDDGALVYLEYDGNSDPAERGQQSILSMMRFETSDERYAWLNRVRAVAKGEFTGEAVCYEIFELR